MFTLLRSKRTDPINYNIVITMSDELLLGVYNIFIARYLAVSSQPDGCQLRHCC